MDEDLCPVCNLTDDQTGEIRTVTLHRSCWWHLLNGGKIPRLPLDPEWLDRHVQELLAQVGPRGGEAMNLREEIAAVLNRHSAENGSNTPDFILAEFLESCLLAFDTAVRARARWYGRSDRPAQFDPPKIETDRSMPKDRVDLVDKRGAIVGQITELGDEATRYVAGKNLVRPTFAAEPEDPNEEHLSAHPEFGEEP